RRRCLDAAPEECRRAPHPPAGRISAFPDGRTSALRFGPGSDITSPMLAKVCSAAVNGIEAYPVEVEVNAGYGDTVIVIVGLPDAAVKESRDRVMTALINSGFNFTFGRTTINLAPADVKKEGPSFDLPIAIGMVAASEQTETDQLENFALVGELALDGAVAPLIVTYPTSYV